jgi:hypothetical protein
MLRLLDELENELTGCISTRIHCLGEELLLQGNKLGGPLPELIVLCSSLKMNDLRQCKLIGYMPISLGGIGPSLKGLSLLGAYPEN